MCFNQISIFLFFHKTALHVAVENKNYEIVQLLLSSDKINVNIPYIYQ